MRSIRFSKGVRKLSKQFRPLSLTAAIQRRIARRPDFLECFLSKRRVSFSRRLYALGSEGEASNNPSRSACSSGSRFSCRFCKAPSTPFSRAYSSGLWELPWDPPHLVLSVFEGFITSQV